MRQFLKGSILLLVLSSWMLSCQEENKFNWENAIIRSEKDAILISSFDVVSLIKKSNPSENEQLNFSQNDVKSSNLFIGFIICWFQG